MWEFLENAWAFLWLHRAVLEGIAVVALGILSLYLKNNWDTQKVREEVAKLVGDALAELVKLAQQQMGAVTDEQLDGVSGTIYDKGVSLLPAKLAALVMAIYSRLEFQAIVQRVWRQYQDRSRGYVAGYKFEVKKAGKK